MASRTVAWITCVFMAEIPLPTSTAGSNMELWVNPSVVQTQREEEKHPQQPKPPVNQAENEIALTIQGQRIVQDIVDRATDLFRRLQSVKLSGDATTRQSQTQNREIRDNLNALKALFARLRVLYNETKRRVNVPVEESFEDIIPLKNQEKDDIAMEVVDEKDPLFKEHQALQQTLKKKNEQVQELMDAMRTMIWDINTMVALKPP